MARFPRGSQWRRWDLHIHTPGTKKNCGEQSMFLVENAHEPIVSKEIFEDVQRRKHKM